MGAGQPKRFKTGEKLIQLWETFCRQIVSEGYQIAPTQTEFCNWLREHCTSTDMKTIYNSLNKYFPETKKEFERIRGDVLTQGAMLGKYHATMTIFALKNWCNWSDGKREEENTIEKLDKIIEGLNNAAQR